MNNLLHFPIIGRHRSKSLRPSDMKVLVMAREVEQVIMNRPRSDLHWRHWYNFPIIVAELEALSHQVETLEPDVIAKKCPQELVWSHWWLQVGYEENKTSPQLVFSAVVFLTLIERRCRIPFLERARA